MSGTTSRCDEIIALIDRCLAEYDFDTSPVVTSRRDRPPRRCDR